MRNFTKVPITNLKLLFFFWIMPPFRMRRHICISTMKNLMKNQLRKTSSWICDLLYNIINSVVLIPTVVKCSRSHQLGTFCFNVASLAWNHSRDYFNWFSWLNENLWVNNIALSSSSSSGLVWQCFFSFFFFLRWSICVYLCLSPSLSAPIVSEEKNALYGKMLTDTLFIC